MVPPANGGVETEQSGEKGLQNLTKIRKEVKHIPCIDVRLQRRMLHFAAVTNKETKRQTITKDQKNEMKAIPTYF